MLNSFLKIEIVDVGGLCGWVLYWKRCEWRGKSGLRGKGKGEEVGGGRGDGSLYYLVVWFGDVGVGLGWELELFYWKSYLTSYGTVDVNVTTCTFRCF